MSRTVWIGLLSLGYLLILFGVAYAADRSRERGHSPADSPWVYSLSLAVFCTSWTVYGSVGLAASKGLDFLPIYLGPTLVFLIAPAVLRPLLRRCRQEGVTSVPDLLESLYGRGRLLGTLATTLTVVGVTPYIGLQLTAVGHTFDLLAGREASGGVLSDASFWAAVGLSLFAVLFGARNLATSERHEGLVTAVAFESGVKLLAVLLVGCYITCGIGGGFRQVFSAALANRELADLFILGPPQYPAYVRWISLSVLAAGAVVLLPRQFHLIAVENAREEHLVQASWIFPAYLLLINLFVLPVALVGRLTDAPGSADYYLVTIPLEQGHHFLSFLSFVGGFSAAASMVIVSSIALATMILHHPGVFLGGRFVSGLQSGRQMDLSRPLLYGKRAVIVGVILLGYGFNRWIGESLSLVNIGLLSFSAMIHFVPALFLGMYWRGGRRAGALVGLLLGFAVWTYTLLLPSFAEAGWMSHAFLVEGLWGLEWLRPRALFGLRGLDPWSHALVWSLVFNLGGYVIFSLLSEERLESSQHVVSGGWAGREELETVLARFVGADRAHQVLADLPERTSPQVLLETTERCLATVLGTPSAHAITRSFVHWPREKVVEVLDVFGGVSQTLVEDRDKLQRRLRELMVLYDAARTLSRSLDLGTLLREVMLLVQREFGFECLAVRLLDEDGMLRIHSHVGLDEEYIALSVTPPTSDTYFGKCFLDGQSVVVEDTLKVREKGPLLEQLMRKVPVTAFVQAPMLHEGSPVGVLSAYGTRGPMHFTDEFLGLFAALADQLALAVVNARLYAEVQTYSQVMEEKVKRRTGQLEEANQRLQELNRLKSEFLSTVSHELRTPLTAIHSFSEILLRYGVDDSERRTKFVHIIHEESERLTRMINNLLDLSKIEAGRQELSLAPLDLDQALRAGVDAARPLFAEAGVQVVVYSEPDLPPVRADKDGLKQVLANLLSNAVKFSPRGGLVRVTGRRRGWKAVVSVADVGPGIPRDRLSEVFERYTQVRDPQKDHPLGTGLGLSISRDIVHKMGGVIWVESQPGEGTTFSFTLPLRESA